MAATTAAELQQLQVEIERLNRELDQASSENIQSAKYGLGLLEEKQGLQSKCEELEALYENARHELEITQEVSEEGTESASHRQSASDGVIDYYTVTECVRESKRVMMMMVRGQGCQISAGET